MSRLHLSPPELGGQELEFVRDAFASNWIAPLGPHVDAFEREFADAVGARHAAALSSGTAAIHLALRLSGVRRGDEVLCSTLTFVASANPIAYEGGAPVFVDSDERSWNVDPALLAGELDAAARRGRLPRAAVVVDLYGQCADLDPIRAACDRHGVSLIEDAAEALGATYQGASAGTRGRAGAFSFNGNKIITTSGGGMLVSDDAEFIRQARFLASQGKDPAPHYEHSRLAYNYRLSNVLAALGRGQLRTLAEKVRRRRQNFEFYRRALGALPGVRFMPEAPYGTCTRWLTAVLFDPEEFGATREDVRLRLEADEIEARPVWKPLHLQPLYSACRRVGGGVAERLFERGLCLPSGSGMTEADLTRVVEVVAGCRGLRARRGLARSA
jgi:pyridoxal phosphate-dependent aminotransferase EpsN